MSAPRDKNGHVSVEHFAALQAAALDQGARHANEVKLLAGLKDNEERRWYIEGKDGVRQRRGDEAAERLRRDVWSYMKNNQGGERDRIPSSS